MTIESKAQALGLIPCPFCGTYNITLQEYQPPYPSVVLCYSCGAVGPDGEDKQEALDKWNRRAQI